MTREEIINGLGDIDVCQTWEDEVIDEAIKALSQEPCTDAVSREDAIKHLTKARMIGDSRPMTEIFAEIPSVTQKSGKWIETEYHRWRCSVCREKGMSEWDNIHNVRTNFCPNCGADMRGAE